MQADQKSPLHVISPFGWYMTNQVIYFNCQGIALVLFPWLVTVVLQAPAQLVGAAQAALMLPLLLFLLLGGAKADRSHLKNWMMRLYTIGFVPPFVLLVLLATDNLSYWTIIIYALTISSVGAFIGPARDSLLTRVTATDTDIGMQRAVGFATAGQFGAQFVGIALAGQADYLGAPFLAGLIAIGYLCCIFAISRLPDEVSMQQANANANDNKAPAEDLSLKVRLREIGEGLQTAWSSDRIRPTIILVAVTGFLFMGAVMVFLPLMVRDIYNGGALHISLLFVCFFGGIGISSSFLSQNPLRNQGQALMLAATIGAMAMGCFYFAPPLWLFYVIVLVWGLSGGVSMSMSRTIVQSAAPETVRARVLSVFLLSMTGTGPIGSLLYGFAIQNVGLLNTALIPVLSMVLIWPAVFLWTDLWSLKAKGASA